MESKSGCLDDYLFIWTTQLENSSLDKEDKEELKIHMEDTLTELLSTGLSDSDIWLIASTRMGNILNIESEYNKVNPDIEKRNIAWHFLSGAIFMLAAQMLFILIPVYLFIDSDKTRPWYVVNTSFYVPTIILLFIAIVVTLRGKQISKSIRTALNAHLGILGPLLILIIIASGYFTIQLIRPTIINTINNSGPAFKTLTIVFYSALIIATTGLLLLKKDIKTRSIYMLSRQMNWKNSLLLGLAAGLLLTFTYTYHNPYLPAITGVALFGTIGWMISFSDSCKTNLLVSQLYIMGLWLSGIFGPFFIFFHVYYFVTLGGLLAGFSWGKYIEVKISE